MRIYEELAVNWVWDLVNEVQESTVPLDELHRFDAFMQDVRNGLDWYEQDEPLRLSLEHLLAKPDYDLSTFFLGSSFETDEEMRPIVTYFYERLWPDAPPIPEGGPPNVELVPAPPPDWNVGDRWGPDAPPSRVERERASKR